MRILNAFFFVTLSIFCVWMASRGDYGWAALDGFMALWNLGALISEES